MVVSRMYNCEFSTRSESFRNLNCSTFLWQRVSWTTNYCFMWKTEVSSEACEFEDFIV